MTDIDNKKGSSRHLNFLSKLYLISYNILSAIGWFYILITIIQVVTAWKQPNKDFFTSKKLYSNIRVPLKVLLATSYLEIFHAIFKLVPSNAVIVFVQVFIRFMVVWSVTDTFKMVIFCIQPN
jgi:very-long-chain (3R)-3-hydroxyacyl-CoA dehydratase